MALLLWSVILKCRPASVIFLILWPCNLDCPASVVKHPLMPSFCGQIILIVLLLGSFIFDCPTSVIMPPEMFCFCDQSSLIVLVLGLVIVECSASMISRHWLSCFNSNFIRRHPNYLNGDIIAALFSVIETLLQIKTISVTAKLECK